jgi:hypothetical protein
MDGYIQVIKDLYEPKEYFGRLDGLYLKHKTPSFPSMRDYYRQHPWRGLGQSIKDLGRTAGLFTRLMRRVPEASLRREYRRACRKRRPPGGG